MKLLIHSSLLLAVPALLAGTVQSQNSVSWSKTVGNNDAKAVIEFKSSAIQGDDLFLDKRYLARAVFRADGKVLGKNLSFIDVGAHAESHEGGIVFPAGYLTGPAETQRVWLYLGGKQMHTSGASEWTKKVTVPLAGVDKKVTVGLFTVKVSAGTSVTVGPILSAEATKRYAEISAGAEASLKVSASGGISAGPVGSVKVTSNIGLVNLGGTLTSKSTPSYVGGGITLSGAALTILIKLKCTVAASLITYKETLVDKTYGTWSKFFAF